MNCAMKKNIPEIIKKKQCPLTNEGLDFDRIKIQIDR